MACTLQSYKSPVVSCLFISVAPEGDNNKGVDTVSNMKELSNTPSTVTSASYPGDNSDTSSDEDYHKENGMETGNAAPASVSQVTTISVGRIHWDLMMVCLWIQVLE